MRSKWLAIGLIGITLFGPIHGMTYGTVLDRPTLFLEVLRQNERLSKSAVVFMQQYLENPTAKELAVLKGLFRKMIGDAERKYLADNGFTVDDFVNSLDAIAQMPESDRIALMAELDKKAYGSALVLLSQYDKMLVVGREVIPLSDGTGKPMQPTNAKMDFEKMLRGTFEKSGCSASTHWSVEHVKWLAAEKHLDEATLLLNNPLNPISQKDFANLLKTCFEENVNLELGEKEQPITRIEAMQLLYTALRLDSNKIAGMAENGFSDTESLTQEEQSCIQALASHDVIKGYANGTIKPSQSLSYGEAWTMLRRALD